MTWSKHSNKTWVVNVFIIHLNIFFYFFVSIISTDCWGRFVWISRLRVSCSPGLSPAARCRCQDLGHEPCQVSVMSQGRRHYGQPQGSLQLFEADSFFEDESRIMQPISNLVEKVKHNKCSYQNCIIGGGHKWPILEAFSAQVGVTSEHPQRYLTLNIPKYRKSRCDDDFISWKLSLNDNMTPSLNSAPWLSGIPCETYPWVWQYQPHSDLPGLFDAPRFESESLGWDDLRGQWNW